MRACHIDALASDGHKWMLGPEGCAILYMSQELQDRVEPVEFGWTNVAGYNDYALPRHDLATGCRPVRMRDAKYHWMLRIEGIN